MTYERDEWLSSRKLKEHVNGHLHDLQMLTQAAVKAELLTGDKHWDYFLTLVQAAIDKTEDYAAQHQEKLTSPDVLDQQELIRLKIEIACCRAMIQAWQAMLSLPGDLIREGDRAKDILSRMEVSPRETDG